MSTRHNPTIAFTLLAIIWVYFLGNVGGWVAPEIVFSLIGARGYGEGLAGGVAGLELLGVALGSLGLAFCADRLPVRRMAIIAAIALVFTEYLSSLLLEATGLALLRLLCGTAQGVLMGLANAVLANGCRPHARLAAANVVNVLLGSALLFVLAPLQQAFTGLSLFTILALVCLVLTPFCFGLQPRLVQQQHAPRRIGLPNAASYWLVAAMAVFACGSGAAFTFSFVMGSQAGLADSSINSTLSLAILGAIPGSLLCGVLGERFKPLLPLLVVLVIHALATFSAALAGGYWSFSLGIAGVLFGSYFILPYLQGLSSQYDPLGGTSAAIGGAFFLTMAGGAYVGGALVEVYGLSALGWLVAGGNLVAGLFIGIALYGLGSKRAVMASYA
ncbi:hypothetical protein DM819_16490 [Pseudomonas hunanensis]|uniref:MFS transporter n=1 Tax=Pseudomonas hunanensis TaxID=1247546 RepID=A0ABD6N0P6_9PSED|nr:MFS transporter [Pseudomonas hunanensis]NWL47406.1 hypothetical protein [Pseudomonas hunanensis]